MAGQVLIGIGSNLGDRVSYLHRALSAVQACCGTVLDVSSCYESEAVGGYADRRFLNAVFCCETRFMPQGLWAQLQTIEAQLGRMRRSRWANRTIDLDILLWQNAHGEAESLNLPHLKIPHPRMLWRDFVLLPAAEIAPRWQHPHCQRPLSEVPLGMTSVVHKLPQEL